MNKTFALFILLCGVAVWGQTSTHRWVETMTFSGTGTMCSAPIHLWDTKWKIQYSLNGKPPFELDFHNIKTQGRQRLVAQNGGNLVGGNIVYTSDIQEGYLIARGAEAQWTVRVFQYLGRVEEWEWLKWKQTSKQLTPFGSWAGDAGDHEYSFKLEDQAACLRIQQLGEGYLRVEVENESGTNVARTVSNKPGEVVTWIHDRQLYTVKISAVGSKWNLHLEALEEKKV